MSQDIKIHSATAKANIKSNASGSTHIFTVKSIWVKNWGWIAITVIINLFASIIGSVIQGVFGIIVSFILGVIGFFAGLIGITKQITKEYR